MKGRCELNFIYQCYNFVSGYELSFRFRTTLANGILAVGQGETYIKLELYKGQLNFHSSLLNKYVLFS